MQSIIFIFMFGFFTKYFCFECVKWQDDWKLLWKSGLLRLSSTSARSTGSWKWKLTASLWGQLWRRGLPSTPDRSSQTLVLQRLPLLPSAFGEPLQPPYGNDWDPGWWRWSVGRGGGSRQVVVSGRGHWCSQEHPGACWSGRVWLPAPFGVDVTETLVLWTLDPYVPAQPQVE